MSDEFAFGVEWLGSYSETAAGASTYGEISISVAQEVLTELEDSFSRSVRPAVRGLAYELALWLAENWWRLRWEPERSSTDWRLSHALAAAGGGTAWPNITFASDGVHVLLNARRTSFSNGSPVRYLRDLETHISVSAFESGTDQFIDFVLARLSATGASDPDLGALWAQINNERRDVSQSELRRMEALLGFDADEAPAPLLTGLLSEVGRAGSGAVHEIAAAAQEKSLEVMKTAIEMTQSSNVTIRVAPVEGVRSALGALSDALPWQRAEKAAQLVRSAWGLASGPVSDKKLCEALSTTDKVFTEVDHVRLFVGAGFRKDALSDELRAVFRPRQHFGRRFELMRLVGDCVAPNTDSLLPLTDAATDRQKFQRAFAQEFLLPFEELSQRFGTTRRTESDIDDEIEEIAAEYQVSGLLVTTLLVNKGILPRASLSRQAR